MKKTKLQKILGIGLTLALVLSLGLVFAAAPVAADDDEWSTFTIPDAGEDGDYFMDEDFSTIGPVARDIDGYFWAYAEMTGGEDEIMHSLDTEGHSWEITEFSDDMNGNDIIAIVCSPLDADVVYAADVDQVYKTEDGGDAWEEVGDFDTDVNGIISTLAIGWDEDDDPRCFLGCTDNNAGADDDDSSTADTDGIWYLYDVPFGSDWASLELSVDETTPAPDGLDDDLSVLGLAVSPNFDEDAYQAALVVNLEDGDTFLVSHEGSDPGGWVVVEIGDDTGVGFEATEGSDPVFPSDFTGEDWEDEDSEIFLGIVGPLHNGPLEGGVARIYGVDDFDTEVLDDVDDDIRSLDGIGSLGNMQFLAGEEDDPDVWYSWDDGEDWAQASAEGIGPAGAGPVLDVVMDANFDEDAGMGWATTDGDECGFNITTDGGTSWQGVSLLDTAIDQVITGAVISADEMYLVTEDVGNESEVFRLASDWTRVFEDTQYGMGGPFSLISVLDDTIVLAENGGLDIAFSADGGQTFAEPDEEPTENITALLVLGDEDWWLGDTDGDLWITDDAGDRAWDEYEIDAGDDITSLAVRGDEAIAGTVASEVYYSEDAGETWDEVGSGGDFTAATTADVATYVCFDEGNDNTDVIYAASDDVVARFQYLTTDLDEDWEEFDDTVGAVALDDATSIACSDGVVYVGNGDDAEGMVRIVEPLFDLDDVAESEVDELVDEGIDAGGDILDGGIMVTAASPNVVWGIDTTAADTALWTYEDLMVGPATGIVADPGDLEYTLSWDGFDNATDYEVAVYEDEDFRAVYVEFDADTGDDEPMLIDEAGVTAGTTYWVQVRGSAPVHSKWSAVYTFSTDPGAVGIDEDTLAPQLGAMNVPIDTPFSWGFDEDADSYLIELSDVADFSNIIDSATVTVPAYQSAVTLNEGTNYWFRVYAISGGQMGNPAYSSFTTATTAVAPTPPAATPSAPVEVIQQSITPNYIYAIIGIGAALAILVIVLITKVKRP